MHRGRVQFRMNPAGGGTVLCPYGHLVTSWRPGEWAGSYIEARISAGWDVECDGALPGALPHPQ